MSLVKKIMTALRGHATEAGEAIVDSQAFTILEQEIKDAKNNLKSAEKNLAQTMADKKIQEKEVESIESQISDYEVKMKGIVEKLDASSSEEEKQKYQTLAERVYDEIKPLETDVESRKTIIANLEQSIKTTKERINKTNRLIKTRESEISSLKATENLNKAQRSAQENLSGAIGTGGAMNDTMDRIRNRQTRERAMLESEEELANERSGASLDKELEAAGIGGEKESVSDYMDRFR